MCQASQAMLVPKPNNSLVSTHRLWRKLTRPFEVALQPSEFPRPPRADVTFSNSNGNGLPSTDNRMLLTDPSVLPPPKVRCLTRDCGSRDSKVPGSQLRVTNGVSPTQIFQLPTWSFELWNMRTVCFYGSLLAFNQLFTSITSYLLWTVYLQSQWYDLVAFVKLIIIALSRFSCT